MKGVVSCSQTALLFSILLAVVVENISEKVVWPCKTNCMLASWQKTWGVKQFVKHNFRSPDVTKIADTLIKQSLVKFCDCIIREYKCFTLKLFQSNLTPR